MKERVNARAFCAWEGHSVEVRIDRSRRKAAAYDLTFEVSSPVWVDGHDVDTSAIVISRRLQAETLEDAIVESRHWLGWWAQELSGAMGNLTWS